MDTKKDLCKKLSLYFFFIHSLLRFACFFSFCTDSALADTSEPKKAISTQQEPKKAISTQQEDEPPFQVVFVNVEPAPKKNPSDPDEIIVDSNSKFGLQLIFTDLQLASSLGGGLDFLNQIVKQGLEDFSTSCQGRSITSVQYGADKKSNKIILDFALCPKREGSLQIGPFECKLGNQKYTWPMVHVTAKKISINDKKACCFATLEMTGGTSCFIWQQKKLQLKIFFDPSATKVRNVDLSSLSIPDFEFKQLGQSSGKEAIDGKLYQVETLDYAVTPKKTGIHEIPAIEVSFLVKNKDARPRMGGGLFGGLMIDLLDEFGGMTESFTRSNCLHIDVLDLPPSDKNVSALGTFTSLNLSLGNKRECERSEPVILKLSLEGSGDFASILHPDLELPSFIKHYASKEEFQETPGTSGLSGKKDFEYVLQIDSAGEVVIPSQCFEYFDPNKKEFIKIKSQDLKIFVRDSKAKPSDQPAAKKQEEKALVSSQINKEDNKYTKKNHAKNLELQRPVQKSLFAQDRKLPWTLFFSLQILLLLAALLWWLQSRIIDAYKRRYCLNISIKRLREMADAGNVLQFYQIIISYFAGKLEIKEFDLGYDLLLETLQKKYKFSDKTWADFLQFMHQCQEVSFGYRKIQTTELRNLVISAEKWLRSFEQLFKTGIMGK